MALAGTKLRSWERRLETARRKVQEVEAEVAATPLLGLQARLEASFADLGECLSILGTTIEICRDARGKRSQPTL